MLVKINSGKSYSSGRPIQGNKELIYLQYKTDAVDYFLETKKYIYLIDTNLSKDREAQLFEELRKLDQPIAEDFERIFHGNYFIVLINKKDSSVQLFRDACGVKTGYFSLSSKTMVVGSVMHEVAKESYSSEYNKEAVHQLIYSGYLIDGYTLYEDVEELKMGHSLKVNANLEIEEINQYKVELSEEDNNLNPEENFQQLRLETQKAHEGYLGKRNRVFLSGGLDSIAMLISLDDLETCKNLDSISFRVKGTQQDETVYAKSIAKHLKIENHIKNIDVNDSYLIQDFEKKVLKMNNPYFGTWIFGNFRGNPSQIYYAGQDTRLHTPALNEIDRWAFRMLTFRNSWIQKYLARPISKGVRSVMEYLKWDKKDHMVFRNLYKLTHIFELENYVRQFYLKLDKKKMQQKGLPVEYYDLFKKQFQLDFDKIKTPRALYNELVKLKWKEQYIYDMRYLQDVARMNNTYIAMPFYNKRLAEFSSSIPFNLATKPMIGRARFGKKKRVVYKYALRKAFKDKLNDLTYYRAKAVSQTLHQMFNGVLGAKVRYLIERDLEENQSFIKEFKLQNYVNKFLQKEEFKKEDVDLLSRIYYIATLTVYHKHLFLSRSQFQNDKNFSSHPIAA